MVPAAVLVNVPELVIVRGPLFDVVILAPRVTAPAEIVMPAAPVVVKSPLKVAAPVPVEEIVAAETA